MTGIGISHMTKSVWEVSNLAKLLDTIAVMALFYFNYAARKVILVIAMRKLLILLCLSESDVIVTTEV